MKKLPGNPDNQKSKKRCGTFNIRAQRGQSLVEFALALPVLLLILLGIIEFARIMQAYLTVQHAARVGARYAITGQHILVDKGPDGVAGTADDIWAARPSSIITTTHSAAIGLARVRPNADTAIREPQTNLAYYYDVVLDPPDGGIPHGAGITDTITVTVHYNVPLLTPIVNNLLGNVVHVTGQAVMQNEAFNPTPGAYVYTMLNGPGTGGTGGTSGNGTGLVGGGTPGTTPTPTPTATPVNCSAAHTQTNIPGSGNIATFTLDNFTGIDNGDAMQVVVNDGTSAWTYSVQFKTVDSAPTIDHIQIQYPDTSIVYNSPTGLAIPMTITNPLTLNLLDLSSVITSAVTTYNYGNTPTVNILSSNTLNVSFTTDTANPAAVCLTTSSLPPTVTPTPTLTPPPTQTPTATATPMPITLNQPLNSGNANITGIGQSGLLVTLRDFSRTGAPVIGTGTILPDGTFSVPVFSPDSNPALVGGHIIVGSAGNSADSTIVNGGPTATPTTTPTPIPLVPTPTATPSVVCFSSGYSQNNLPGSGSISAFTLSNLTGIDNKDKLSVLVDDGTHTWEYKIDFKGNPAKIDKIQIKYDGNKVYKKKGMGLSIPGSLDLLNLSSVISGAPTTFDYNDYALSGSNTLTVSFTKDNGATGGACLTFAGAAGGTATPTPTPGGNGATCFSSILNQNNIPGSSAIANFTLDTFTGIDNKDKLSVLVDDGTHTWEYKIDFKGNPAKIDKIQIKYNSNKVYDSGGGLGLSIPASLDLLNLSSVISGAPTTFDYNDYALSGSNTLTVSFTKDNGATGGACLTATVSPQPDLLITAMRVISAGGSISANQPFTVEVTVKNQGQNSVNSLSWVNLYGDPTSAPPAVGQMGQTWAGVNSLAAGSLITLTLTHPGLAATGSHLLYSQADTWNQIAEGLETNNVYGPITATVSGTVVVPTPTPTPVNPGGVSGATWLFLNGDLLPIGFAQIELRSGGNVIATTSADAAGNYTFGMTIPPGTYDVYGEVTLNGTVYSDISANVQVTANIETPNIILILY